MNPSPATPPRIRIWRADDTHTDQMAGLFPSDRGFALGDGLFETLLWTGDNLRFGTRHMARLAGSAAALGLAMPWDADWILRQVTAFVADCSSGPEDVGTKAVRLTLSCGSGPRGLGRPAVQSPILVGTSAGYDPPTDPVHLARVSITRNPDSPSAAHKTLSYIDQVLALRQAKALGGDDALMLSTTGHVACASAANIVVLYQGAGLTPPVHDGAMAGIVRGHLLQAGVIEEAHLTPDMLAKCDGAALTNALIGVRGICAIDKAPFPTNFQWIETLRGALT
ncbi:MAG: hypothetical protein RL186_732 [Pseudomonadota bacterium]|jgi:branched-subunit amino acid aminotransferase/4-amino-4-deoxychorismate lyase